MRKESVRASKQRPTKRPSVRGQAVAKVVVDEPVVVTEDEPEPDDD